LSFLTKYGSDKKLAKHGPYMTHIWEWYGKVGWRYGTDMGLNLPHFNVWKMYGKKSQCYPLYGRAMRTQFSSISHSSNEFACSTTSMGMIRDVHCSIFHRFPISADMTFFKSHRLSIWLFYKIQSEFIKALQEIDSHRVSIWLIYIGIPWGQTPSVKFSLKEFPFEALIENCATKAKLL